MENRSYRAQKRRREDADIGSREVKLGAVIKQESGLVGSDTTGPIDHAPGTRHEPVKIEDEAEVDAEFLHDESTLVDQKTDSIMHESAETVKTEEEIEVDAEGQPLCSLQDETTFEDGESESVIDGSAETETSSFFGTPSSFSDEESEQLSAGSKRKPTPSSAIESDDEGEPMVRPAMSKSKRAARPVLEESVAKDVQNQAEHDNVSLEEWLAAKYPELTKLPHDPSRRTKALFNEPLVRKLVFGPRSQKLPSLKIDENCNGVLAHLRGTLLEGDAECKKCADGVGLLKGCVVLQGRLKNEFAGACANCNIGTKGKRCSLHKDYHSATKVRSAQAAVAQKQKRGVVIPKTKTQLSQSERNVAEYRKLEPAEMSAMKAEHYTALAEICKAESLNEAAKRERLRERGD